MDNPDNRLAALAADQHRVVSRLQANSLLGVAAVNRRVRAGELVRFGYDAYFFRGAAPDWRGLYQASLFDAGPESRLSFASGGRLHRFPSYHTAGAHVLVPRALDHRCDIATVHESRRFDLIPWTEIDGLRVTTPEATLVLLSAGMRIPRLIWMTDELIASQRIDVAELERVRLLLTGRGVPGSAALAAVMADRTPGAPVPESRLERMFLTMCDKYELPRPVWQAPMPGWEDTPGRIDGIYKPERLIIEVDGRRWHTRVADFERDHRRDLQAAAMGYRVARITYLMLKHEAPDVAAQIRRALGRIAA